MKNHKRLFLSVIFFSLTAFSFSADGKPLSLWQIDSLINQKNYTKALEELSIYITEYPDQFDKAQRRVYKIMKAKNQYNSLAIELAEKMRLSAETDDLTDEQQDSLDSQKMDIIVSLEKSSVNQAQEEIDLTNDARRTVKLAYYINRSNLIINQGTAFVESGNTENKEPFLKAVEKFSEGLTLKTNDSDIVFDGESEIPVVYSAELTKAVDRHIKNISNYTLSLAGLFENCQAAADIFIQKVRAFDTDGAGKALAEVNSEFSRLASARNQLLREGKFLKDLDDKVLADNPGLNGTSYITFSKWAILGIDSNPDSGILGSIDAFWNSHVENMKNSVYESVAACFGQLQQNLTVENMFTGIDYQEFFAAQKRAGFLSPLGKPLHSLYELLDDCDYKNYNEYNLSMDFAFTMAEKLLRPSLTNSRNVSSQNKIVEERTVQNEDYLKYGLDQIQSARFYEQNLVTVRDAIADGRCSAELLREDEYNKMLAEKTESIRTSAGVDVQDKVLSFKGIIAYYQNFLSAIEKECAARSGTVWSIIAKTYSDEADRQLTDFTIRNVDAQKNLDGFVENITGLEGISAESVSIVKYYPHIAVDLAQKLNKDIGTEINVLQGYLQTLDGGKAYRTTETAYSAGVINIESVIAALKDLTVKNNTIIAQGRQRIQLAAKDANEGRLNYQRAVVALKKNQFNEARTFLENSRKKYSSSLAQQENDQLRTQTDNEIFQLDQEISQKHNEYIVHETRILKDNARNAYYNGNFEEAEKNLVQAQTLWAVTNIDEDLEIKSLFGLVNTALSMKTGRVLSMSDPLYPEMSQILNIANQYYQQGKNLMEKGQKDQAVEILNSAKEKLRNLQLIYPLNQDASLLSLRIDQLIDPKAFSVQFEQKLANARQDYKIPEKQNQAYADLKDLQSINPDYKGLASLILNIEYEIGIKTRPVDNSAKNESESLYSQAQKIMNSGSRDESQLKRAVTLLDRAIEKDPSNKKAAVLKDKIQTQIGGRATDILSSADEQQYQLAIQQYNRGNYMEAFSIVEQLLVNNSRNKKLIQLQKTLKPYVS